MASVATVASTPVPPVSSLSQATEPSSATARMADPGSQAPSIRTCRAATAEASSWKLWFISWDEMIAPASNAVRSSWAATQAPASANAMLTVAYAMPRFMLSSSSSTSCSTP